MDRHLDAGLLGGAQARVDRGGRRAPVLVQLEAAHAGLGHRPQALARDRVALAEQQHVDRVLVHREQHLADRPRRRRAGRRPRALGRAVPPPISVVTPEATASSTICGQMKCTCPSIAPAVRMRPSPAMISVVGPISMSTPSITSGLPALPSADDPPVLDRDVALDDAPVIEHDDVRDHRVGRAVDAHALQHRLADRLAAAEHRLVAADAAVLLDLQPEVGVGQPHPVADGRPVQRARSAPARSSSQRPAPCACRRARPGRRRARRPARSAPTCPPGCPAGSPAAASRSNASASLTSRELEVRADLDRPVAGVHHPHRPVSRRVELDLALGGDDLAGNHEIGSCRVTSLRPSGNVASTCTSSTSSGTPSITSSRRAPSGPRPSDRRPSVPRAPARSPSTRAARPPPAG